MYDRTTNPAKCLSNGRFGAAQLDRCPFHCRISGADPSSKAKVSTSAYLVGLKNTIDHRTFGIYNHVCLPVARSIGPVEPAIRAQQRPQKWPTRCTRGAHGSVSGDVFRARAPYGIHHDAVLGAGWFLHFYLTLADVQCLTKNHVHLADPSCRSSSGPGVATVRNVGERQWEP